MAVKKKIVKIFPVPKEDRREDYWKFLNNVIDPELGIGIIDLGLVYDVKIEDSVATVTMTFTSMACPMGPSILGRVRQEMEQYPGVEDVVINVVWEPVWTREFIDPDIRTLIFNQ
ncbi:MAG: hypothetical protein ACD_72C00437G0002 [uncultured bacterium]|nr:MAG: hypothetical protein ACD_72C00437G0002 [uncultured bacterium]